MTLLLKNGIYIDWETLKFSRTDILVTEGNIRFVDQFQQDQYFEVIDCTGKLVTKSFAVGHHHAYSALARGMPAPGKAPADFLETLKFIWWKLDKSLDKEMMEASALATAMACAKAGVTFVIDHHSSPAFIRGSLNTIAAAFEKVGLSHLLCYEISDRDGMKKSRKGLEETDAYLSSQQGLVGLHASFTLGDETLRKAAELMQKTSSGVHIHVAESRLDQEDCILNHGRRVVQRLEGFGLLDAPKTILAHCLHLDENERKIIGNSKAFVVQNTESNLNNKVGYFNFKGLGNRIMLGTDGMHSDILRSARAAYFVGQANDEIDCASAYRRFREAHRYLQINGFEGDGEDNLVVLDYDSPTEVNPGNFLSHFIFGLTENHVQHVISGGRLIVKDKVLQTVDENEILSFTREQANRLWGRL